MSVQNSQQMPAMLNGLVQLWHAAVAQPAQAQHQVLTRLLPIDAQTDYSKQQHNAAQIQTIAEYRRACPVTTYDSYQPLSERVMAGEINLLLNEPVIRLCDSKCTTVLGKIKRGTPTMRRFV